MICMKCGSKTADTQVFCDHCLSEMQKYPVKADIRVQLPQRPAPEKKPSAKKPALRPEEQLQRLRRQTKRLSLALICCVLALALTIALLFSTNSQATPEDTAGKNYSTIDTDTRFP